MRSRISIFAAAVAVLGLLVVPASAEVRKGDRASEFRGVKDARGKTVKLKSYRGKWVVVTFGASWCKPCKEELPAYEKLARKLAKKDVVFIAVNIDKDQRKGKAFMKEAGLKKMHAVYDPRGATADIYSPPTMPSTYIIDPRGLVRELHQGFRAGDDDDLARTLAKLMK
jgi:cytochrome c biogenesis protein CcmG, thiol:disulfide interchange protein DsbE